MGSDGRVGSERRGVSGCATAVEFVVRQSTGAIRYLVSRVARISGKAFLDGPRLTCCNRAFTGRDHDPGRFTVQRGFEQDSFGMTVIVNGSTSETEIQVSDTA